jgi:hypothetical protein
MSVSIVGTKNIPKSLFANIRQAVINRSFLIGVVGVVLMVLLSSLEDLISVFRSATFIPYGTHAELLLSVLSSDTCMLALPILCTLPYTTAFVDDSKSGYVKAYLPRAGLGHYIAGKTLSCALSGGLALLLGAIIGYVVLALSLLPIEALSKSVEGQALRILEKLALVFASGALWSLVGFLLASITKSRYMAYAGPFVICYVLVILYERYFDKLYILYPREWLNPSTQWVLGAWGVVLFLFLLCGVVAFVFALWARRKLVEE